MRAGDELNASSSSRTDDSSRHAHHTCESELPLHAKAILLRS
jgi:hypothetical protein